MIMQVRESDSLINKFFNGTLAQLQEEYYNNMIKSRIQGVEYANNSLIIGSGLGDSLWNEALNYEIHIKIS